MVVLPVTLNGLPFGGVNKQKFKNMKTENKKGSGSNVEHSTADGKPMLPAVVWNSIAADDFIFLFGDYCLRVEQMDKNHWWWSVNYKNNQIAFDHPLARTELEAKLLAELSFIRDLAWHSR